MTAADEKYVSRAICNLYVYIAEVRITQAPITIAVIKSSSIYADPSYNGESKTVS